MNAKTVFLVEDDSSTVSLYSDRLEQAGFRTALALQTEEALQALAIDKATKPITAEWDPYKIFQVHDYKSISFLRQQSVVKAASTETIKIFAQNYPELLKEKFFVNVPGEFLVFHPVSSTNDSQLLWVSCMPL